MTDVPSRAGGLAEAQPNAARQPPREVSIQGSPGLADWLAGLHISLAFTTYQTNRLFLLGRGEQGGLAVNERLFDRPMGLFAEGERLHMACRTLIWQLENRLAPGETHKGQDHLYVPALALVDGEAAFATACGSSDSPAGWRHQRRHGGVVMHIPSSEVVATGLSMPHSPRWFEGRLWLLNSGTGELGYLDGARFQPVTYCPGFGRGLAFVGGFAVVGLSKLRSSSLSGLALDERLAADNQASECGLRVIDLRTGEAVHSLQIEGVVEELFDVVVLPGVRRPGALGFQDDTIDRLVNFPGSNGLVVTKPGVRTTAGTALHRPGLPRPEQNTRGLPADTAAGHGSGPTAGDTPIKYQQVFHLTPENLLPYEHMTSPSLRQRWLTQPRRGELLGVSASVGGAMVGFAVAELFATGEAEPMAELISLRVVPAHASGDMQARLVGHLQELVGRPLGR